MHQNFNYNYQKNPPIKIKLFNCCYFRWLIILITLLLCKTTKVLQSKGWLSFGLLHKHKWRDLKCFQPSKWKNFNWISEFCHSIHSLHNGQEMDKNRFLNRKILSEKKDIFSNSSAATKRLTKLNERRIVIVKSI